MALVSTTTLVTEDEAVGAEGALGSTEASGASVLIAFSQPLMMARGVIHAERATKWPPPLGKVTSGGALGTFRGSHV